MIVSHNENSMSQFSKWKTLWSNQEVLETKHINITTKQPPNDILWNDQPELSKVGVPIACLKWVSCVAFEECNLNLVASLCCLFVLQILFLVLIPVNEITAVNKYLFANNDIVWWTHTYHIKRQQRYQCCVPQMIVHYAQAVTQQHKSRTVWKAPQ